MYLCLFTAAKETDKVFAFFHPYCDAGGGGERVLWMTIEAMLKDHAITKNMHIVVYSGSKLSKKELLRHVNERFSINLMSPYLSNKVSFVPIISHVLMDAKWYPVATMIFQCLASVLVGIECICKVMPDFYMDTTGAAFTYPLFRLMSWPCTVLAYVHYPIISSDMLQKVRERRPDYNNSDVISKSTTISTAKLAYYSLVAYAYGVVGGYAHWVLANSSWTKNHIDGLWRTRAMLFYPPCNTEMNEGINLDQGEGEHARTKAKTGGVLSIVSVGQYRPEKDHALQLRAMKLVLDKYGDRYVTTTLIMHAVKTDGSLSHTSIHCLQSR
jgi:alpha-1,2-mannosyltransferase